jgi:phage terminase large subunit-like protein
VLDGICTDLYKNGLRVLNPDDEIEQDNYFYAIFQIDLGDDWTDPQSWYKSNAGLIHGLPRMKYLQDRLKEAQMTIAEKGNFLTKHCDLFVNGSDKFLDIDLVRECKVDDHNFDDFKHKKCWIAIDRARVHDITSICILFAADDGGVDVFFVNLLPEVTVNNVSDYLRRIYNKAVEEGDLTLVRSPTVRNKVVEEQLVSLWDDLPNCEGIYYDPWHMREIAESIEERGIPIVSVSQGTGNLSEPSKKLEGLILEKLLRYNSTLFEYACTCAMMDMTRKDNMTIYRESDKIDKIDPLIATIIALSGATLFKVERNIYEERGMIVL